MGPKIDPKLNIPLRMMVAAHTHEPEGAKLIPRKVLAALDLFDGVRDGHDAGFLVDPGPGFTITHAVMAGVSEASMTGREVYLLRARARAKAAGDEEQHEAHETQLALLNTVRAWAIGLSKADIARIEQYRDKARGFRGE